MLVVLRRGCCVEQPRVNFSGSIPLWQENLAGELGQPFSGGSQEAAQGMVAKCTCQKLGMASWCLPTPLPK